MRKKHKILLTGATGYVGGKLLRRLELDGHQVNCLVRNPKKLSHNVGCKTKVFRGDILQPMTMKQAFEGADTAYFMVHFLHEK
ncbi:MAG: NAD(P)H-binding protein, partial [Kiritimatiellales bacterium]|nr:NAD(P)H-binding protein [Kiritimatiellales bacterium]